MKYAGPDPTQDEDVLFDEDGWLDIMDDDVTQMTIRLGSDDLDIEEPFDF